MRATALAICVLPVLVPASGWAGEKLPLHDDALNPNVVSIQTGGRIAINRYRTGLMLGAGYARWLRGIMFLDAATSVIVHRNTNFALDVGVKWKWAPSKSKVRPYIRTLLEFVVIAESQTQYVIAARVGGGAAYYSSPGFGATLEASISIGPAFGAGSAVASSLDIMAGVEFPF